MKNRTNLGIPTGQSLALIPQIELIIKIEEWPSGISLREKQ